MGTLWKWHNWEENNKNKASLKKIDSFKIHILESNKGDRETLECVGKLKFEWLSLKDVNFMCDCTEVYVPNW